MLLTMIKQMYEFHRGGTLDAQVRYGGSPAYAHCVYGVYRAAHGDSLSEALGNANTYGSLFSHYPHTPMDPTYPGILAKNVANITRGYNDEKIGFYARVNVRRHQRDELADQRD
jgi:hypothetical protein